jgi:protein O-mannosyl-transferase
VASPPYWATRQSALLGGVLLVTLVALLRCLGNRFVFDDHEMIVLNRYIGQWSFLWKSIVNDSWWFRDPLHLPQSSYYRPLQDIWLALNFHLFGLNPAGWHATMIALHLVVVWLVYRVASRLADDSYVGLTAALLFGLLPVHAEAVAWPSAIPFPLSAVLEIGAFSLIIGNANATLHKIVPATVLYALALFSHESAVVFPLLVALYAFFLKARGKEGELRGLKAAQLRARQAIFVAAPFALETAAYLVIRYLVLGFINRPNPVNHMTNLQELLTIPHVLLTYLLLLAVPWLAAPSHRLLVVSSAASPEFFVPVLLLGMVAAGFAFAIRAHPRRNLYLFCALWMAVAIAPMMNLRGLFEQALIQDRYLYMPSVGCCLMAADWAVRFARRQVAYRTPILAAGAVMALALAAGLWIVQGFWHDEIALFTRCVREFPESMIWHNRLGMAFKEQGNLAGAERELSVALQIEPDDGGTLYDLGLVHLQLGRPKQGADEMLRGLKHLPHAPAGAYALVARVYDGLGEAKRADELLKRAEALPNGYEVANLVRIELMLGRGEHDRAEELARGLTNLYPNDPRPWVELGFALMSQQRDEEAVSAFSRASAVAPGDAQVRFYLASALHKTGRERDALEQCRIALEIDPANRNARVLMAEITARLAKH